MKPKFLKRIISNKSPRRSSISSIFPVEPAARHHTYPIDMSQTCFKANLTLKPPKSIKRDLLRSNDSRLIQFSSSTHLRRSHSADAVLSSRKIDPFGPWTEHHHPCLTSKKRDLSRPLKNSRLWKNSNVSSPKSLSNENTSFESSIDMSIEQYRKNKGYRLEMNRTSAKSTVKQTPLPLPPTAPIINKSTVDLLDHTNNTSPSIPSMTKIISVPYYIHNFPSITMRNGHLRPTRHPPHHPPMVTQQTVALPALTGSSINYLNTLSSNTTKSVSSSQSKLFFIHGRKKKRISTRSFTHHKNSTRPIDYSELRAHGDSIFTHGSESISTFFVYEYSRGHAAPSSTSQSDIGPLI